MKDAKGSIDEALKKAGKAKKTKGKKKVLGFKGIDAWTVEQM